MKSFEELDFSAQKAIFGGQVTEPTRSAGGTQSHENKDGTTSVHVYCYDLIYGNGEVWYVKDTSPTNR